MAFIDQSQTVRYIRTDGRNIRCHGMVLDECSLAGMFRPYFIPTRTHDDTKTLDGAITALAISRPGFTVNGSRSEIL